MKLFTFVQQVWLALVPFIHSLAIQAGKLIFKLLWPFWENEISHSELIFSGFTAERQLMIQKAKDRIGECLKTENPVLDLSDFGISNLNEVSELFDCLHVTELDLSRNYIKNMDASGLSKLLNLTTLDLSRNRLSDVSNLGTLLNLTTLDLSHNYMGNVDVSGVSKLVNLTTLNLSNNLLSDVSVLDSLLNLTILDLSGNRLSDVSGLGTLVNLTTLDLSSNELTDVGNLGTLLNLTTLDLSENPLSDVSGLSKLLNLTILDLSGNRLTDVNGLGWMPNLTTLYLFNNELSDLGVSGLSSLTNLTELYLSKNRLSNVSGLDLMLNLTTLYLSQNQLTDVDGLSSLVSLTTLDLSNNQLTDVGGLSKLHNLTELDLSNNQLTDVGRLSKLHNLTELNLYRNQIADVDDLGSLINLTKLSLGGNELKDLDSLGSLHNLAELYLNNTQFFDLSVLGSLLNLRILDLSNNELFFVEEDVLSMLTNLTELDLSGSQLVDVSGLATLTNLTELDLSDNQLVDFRPLLLNETYRSGRLNDIRVDNNPNFPLNYLVKQGYPALKAYYDTLDAEGKIQNDQLKVILLGNSTAGKTSLVKYWGNKTFDEKQTTTHGIYTPKDFPLNEQDPKSQFKVNIWDFGGQDYYHATHRLFVTRESTYVLVCNKHLEDKPAPELTPVDMQIGEEVKSVEVLMQHYPYRYWLQTLAFLTQSGKIDDPENKAKDKSQLPKLFLVENKCGIEHAQSKYNQRMRLDEKLSHTLPFEVVGGDFYHIDIQKAYQYQEGKDTSDEANAFHLAYRKFEKQLLQTLRTQIENNRYEVHANFPKIRDILASMAAHMQNREPSPELNEYLAANKIAPIESYQKLPVWISYDEYRDIVERNSKSKFEDIEGFLHTYLQNLCGRIFHFKDVIDDITYTDTTDGERTQKQMKVKDIVFIEPNWLHQTIYKVLNQKVLDNKGEFTIHDADAVIDGNIMDAATFLDAMKAFDLIFEIPNQDPQRFVAPQYLPEVCPLHTAGLYSLIEENYDLALTLEFSYYLPSSLISRIISKKGHLIKNRQQFLWRNGLLYTDENQVSVFIECKPSERRIEILLNKKDKNKIQQTLRELMTLLEENFSDEIADAYVVLPTIKAKAKWKHLLKSKEGRQNKVKNYEEQGELVDAEPFWFLFREFERKPLNVFVCYSHDDQTEMEAFTHELTKQLNSFGKQQSIKINPFTDLELKTGMLWDTVLQERIAQNDLLICLLSPTFFTSSYIQEKEYGKMKQLAQQNPNKLIAPIYVKSCYISEDNEIANLQFYKPLATRFGLSQSIKEFSFSNLLHHHGGSYVQNYVKGFVEEIGGSVLRIHIFKC